MNARLQRVADALRALSARALQALGAAADRSPQVVPGLLAWIEFASGWELDRRAGRVYRLAEPMDAIAPEEVASSAAAIVAIAAAFAGALGADVVETNAVVEFLDATMAMLPLPTASSTSLH